VPSFSAVVACQELRQWPGPLHQLLVPPTRCLHPSSSMQSTEAFCRDVLCDPDLVDFVNAQLTSWGGDIRQPDPYGVSHRLSVRWCVAMTPGVNVRVWHATRLHVAFARLCPTYLSLPGMHACVCLQLSLRLAVTGYPYVALLHARPNNTVRNTAPHDTTWPPATAEHIAPWSYFCLGPPLVHQMHCSVAHSCKAPCSSPSMCRRPW
jgi:hypothetical protein